LFFVDFVFLWIFGDVDKNNMPHMFYFLATVSLLYYFSRFLFFFALKWLGIGRMREVNKYSGYLILVLLSYSAFLCVIYVCNRGSFDYDKFTTWTHFFARFFAWLFILFYSS